MQKEPCGLHEDMLDTDSGTECDHYGRPTNGHRIIKHISILLLVILGLVVLGIYLFTTNTQNAPGQQQVSPWRNIGQ
jgi:hypothetical protein